MTEAVADDEGRIHLVGTAHVSATSVEEVRSAIAEREPDVVAVELDEARYRQLKGEGPEDLDPGDLLRGNTVFQFLAYWMLSYLQSRLGERFDIEPGADMKAAIEAAEERDIPVALVDRDINVTIQRFWAGLTAREKVSLLGGLTFGLAPPLQVGAAVGVAVGLLVGILLGTVGAGALGIDGATFAAAAGPAVLQATGTLVVGLGVGLLLWALAGDLLGGVLGSLGFDGGGARLAVGVAVGVAATGAVGLAGGLAVGPLSLGVADLAAVGGTALSVLAGLAVGVVAFGTVGLAVGLLFDRRYADELEELEELDIERMTDTDVVSVMMEEFRRFSPRGAEALIDERDSFIASELLALRAAGRDVVAVVGAGHVEGIERHLGDPSGLPSIDALTERASGRRFSLLRVASYLFMLGFLAFFALLALAGVSQPFLIELFVAWFLFNGVFAFGMAKLAGARWSSATVGGLVAWLTSINPLLAPGWFAGYVELRHDPVSVADIGELNDLLTDTDLAPATIVRRMTEVPLFKLIMVVAATNVGSMVASALFFVVVVPWLAVDVGGVDGIMTHLVEGARVGIDVLAGAI